MLNVFFTKYCSEFFRTLKPNNKEMATNAFDVKIL